ncbi:unnamed protein product [Closterium sp. NIES-64]|nr:unnamed protein product [Closterium sp. NIES-64]
MLLRELVEPARKLLPASPYLNPSSNGHPSTPPPNPKKSRHLCATIIQAESRHLCATIIQSFSRFAASSSRVKPSQLLLLVAAVFIPHTPAIPNQCILAHAEPKPSFRSSPRLFVPPRPTPPLFPSPSPPLQESRHLRATIIQAESRHLHATIIQAESLQLHATIIKAVSRFVASSVQVNFTFLPQTLETSQNSSVQAVSRFVASSSRIKPSQLPLLVSAFFISPIPASSLHIAGVVEGARRWSAVLQGVQQMLSAGLNAFECSRGLLPPPKKLSYSIVSSHSSFTSHPALSLPQQIRPTLTLQFHPTPGPIPIPTPIMHIRTPITFSCNLCRPVMHIRCPPLRLIWARSAYVNESSAINNGNATALSASPFSASVAACTAIIAACTAIIAACTEVIAACTAIIAAESASAIIAACSAFIDHRYTRRAGPLCLPCYIAACSAFIEHRYTVIRTAGREGQQAAWPRESANGQISRLGCPKIPAQERAYEEKSVWIRGGGLQVDGWNGGENGKDGEDGKRRAIPFPAWEEVLMYGSRAMPLAWMLQPLEQISPFYFSGCSSMSCGADGEGTGSIDRSRGGKSSGGSESSGGRDSSGEGVTGGSELLSQEGKRSWVQWCLPPPRDDYRDKEFIQAFIQILSADPTALRTGGLDVRFTGEGGAAGPGVLREFFAFVRAHLFDPNLGLFSPVPHDPSRFSLSLASRANPAEAKEYLRFAGRILALALAHQVPLGVKLSRSLFVLLAARTPSLADAADDDPQLVASCRSLLAMAEREREEAAQGGGGREGGGVESLCLTFVASVEDPMGGAPIEAELVPGGSERVVRADDVAEFVQRMVQFRVCGVVEEEGEALRRGMEDILGSGGGRDVIVGKGDVVEGREGTDGKGGMGGTEGSLGGLGGGFERDEEQHLSIHKDDDCCGDSIEGLSLDAMLAPLSCDDLNLLLRGEDRHVAVSDWQAHTVYHGYCPEDPQVLWFWEVVESLSGEQRKSLLFFATAVSNLPVNGFKGLAMGFHLHRADGDLSRLPTAHTCFHQFLLPPYESIEMMRMRLLTLVSTSYIVHSFGFA